MTTKAEIDFAAAAAQITAGIGAIETEVNVLQTSLNTLTATVTALSTTATADHTALSTLQSAVTALTATVAALGGTTAPTAPTLPPGVAPNSLAAVTVQPGTTYPTLASALLAVANGGVITVAANPATYNETNHIDGAIFPGVTVAGVLKPGLTIQGAAGEAYQTIFNGNGLRLAWQNGIIHTTAPILIKNIGFTNASNGTTTSSGQAAIYCDHPVGTTVTIENCAIFGNKSNGIQGAAGSGALVTQGNEFGFNKATGAFAPNGLPDGLSHDIYAQGAVFTDNLNKHFCCDLGHGSKSRCLVNVITGNYYAHGGGRCIDLPDGCPSTTIMQCTFTDLLNSSTVSGSDSTNMFAFGDESSVNVPATGSTITFIKCTFGISRFATVVWNNAATSTLTADSTCVFSSYDQTGVAGPSLVLQGPGAFSGFPAMLPAPTTAFSMPPSTV